MRAAKGHLVREGKWTTSLMMVVHEKKEQMSGLPEKKWVCQVPYLPYDLIFKILLLLPAKSLFRLSFVCKTWYRLINSSNFVEAHIRQCETVFVFLRSVVSLRRPNTFSIDANLGRFSLFEPSSSQQLRSYIHLMEFQDGKGKISDPNISGFGNILATCNGLILATNKNGGLLVMNPTTRKLIGLRLGTKVATNDESYGFVFSHHTSEYKVVHLFRDKLRYIGCEIMSLSTRSWRAVDGPSLDLFKNFKHRAVTASGALYWLPGKTIISYLVSMDMDDEKFLTRTLPIRGRENDRLVEIGGFLSFVTHATLYRMQLWILKRNPGGEDWIKQYTINMDYDITNLIPAFTTRNGKEIVFRRFGRSLYVYDFEVEEMKIVELETEDIRSDDSYLPHVSTLASWVNLQSFW